VPCTHAESPMVPLIRLMVAALTLNACESHNGPRPPAQGSRVSSIAISVEAVLLNATDSAQNRVGSLTYAGGLALTSTETTRLHGLSDLEVFPDGRLIAVSDEGDLLRARVVLDGRGTLTGVGEAQLTKLVGLDGRPLETKEDGDAEGLAVLPNGDLLVSFERRHRIWRYPAAGGLPAEAPFPRVTLLENAGIEALFADPSRGPGAYIAGAEASGLTWQCELQVGCDPGPTVAKDEEFGLVAGRRLPNDATVWLLRSFSPATGNVLILRITDPAGRSVDEQRLQRPLTVDNFEGLSAVPHQDRGIRFYLLSDDNFSTSQRTLLLAFDWLAQSK
jgi:hypothetical protein